MGNMHRKTRVQIILIPLIWTRLRLKREKEQLRNKQNIVLKAEFYNENKFILIINGEHIVHMQQYIPVRMMVKYI